jgi:hypothetical protein
MISNAIGLMLLTALGRVSLLEVVLKPETKSHARVHGSVMISRLFSHHYDFRIIIKFVRAKLRTRTRLHGRILVDFPIQLVKVGVEAVSSTDSARAVSQSALLEGDATFLTSSDSVAMSAAMGAMVEMGSTGKTTTVEVFFGILVVTHYLQRSRVTRSSTYALPHNFGCTLTNCAPIVWWSNMAL